MESWLVSSACGSFKRHGLFWHHDKGVLWQSPAGHSLSPDLLMLTCAPHPFPSCSQLPVTKWCYLCPCITFQICQNWCCLPDRTSAPFHGILSFLPLGWTELPWIPPPLEWWGRMASTVKNKQRNRAAGNWLQPIWLLIIIRLFVQSIYSLP